MAYKMNGFTGFASNNGGSPLTKKSTNDPNVSADDKMTADYNKAKTAYLMKNMQYREPTQEEISSGYYNEGAKIGITDFNDPVYDKVMKNFSFKVGGK